MRERPGCMKSCLFGCLGVVGVLLLFLVIMAGTAAVGLKDKQPVDGALDPVVASDASGVSMDRPGRLILDVSQCEMILRPAAAGEPLSVSARYDDVVHDLEERFEVLPDSTWVYELRFWRTMPGMQAFFRGLMSGGTSARVEVRIPPDLPLGLELRTRQGGFEAELGGLWITDADIDFSQGGFSLEIDEPLREPMDHFVISGSMGGFAAEGLGNASPRVLVVDQGMGGADVMLDGAWRNDADIQLKIRMGGMSVTVPDDVVARGVSAGGGEELLREGEVPPPVLRFTLDQSMGEIEVR